MRWCKGRGILAHFDDVDDVYIPAPNLDMTMAVNVQYQHINYLQNLPSPPGLLTKCLHFIRSLQNTTQRTRCRGAEANMSGVPNVTIAGGTMPPAAFITR